MNWISRDFLWLMGAVIFFLLFNIFTTGAIDNGFKNIVGQVAWYEPSKGVMYCPKRYWRLYEFEDCYWLVLKERR